MSELTGPPPTDTMLVSLLFQDGKAYAAPIGSSTVHPESWKRVKSLEALAEFLQVPFEVEVS